MLFANAPNLFSAFVNPFSIICMSIDGGHEDIEDKGMRGLKTLTPFSRSKAIPRQILLPKHSPLDIYNIDLSKLDISSDEDTPTGILHQKSMQYQPVQSIEQKGTDIFESNSIPVSDSFGNASRYYSPVIISTLKEQNFRCENEKLQRLVEYVERSLKKISKKHDFRREQFAIFNQTLGWQYFGIVAQQLSEKDTIALLSCVSILSPSTKAPWSILDEAIAKKIRNFSSFGSLYCAFCIQSSIAKLDKHFGRHMQLTSRTAEAAIDQIMLQRDSENHNKNVIAKGLDFEIDFNLKVDSFASIGTSEVG